MTALPNPMPPLTSETRQELQASIRERGVILPAVHDQHGRTLDGRNREHIAGELGVELPTPIVVQVHDDEHARRIAVELNTARRHLSVPDRRAIVAGLRAEGRSTRAIAEAVGVDQKTVRNDLKASGEDKSSPERVVGRDGRKHPSRRAKPAPRPVTPVPPASSSNSTLLYATGEPAAVMHLRRAEEILQAGIEQGMSAEDRAQHVALARPYLDRLDTLLRRVAGEDT